MSIDITSTCVTDDENKNKKTNSVLDIEKKKSVTRCSGSKENEKCKNEHDR